MAMNASLLAAEIVEALYPLWREEPPADKAQDEDYFLLQFATVIAEKVVGHIKTHARCSGLDSHNDSHDNVGIV